jgi:hypothetical protein
VVRPRTTARGLTRRLGGRPVRALVVVGFVATCFGSPVASGGAWRIVRADGAPHGARAGRLYLPVVGTGAMLAVRDGCGTAAVCPPAKGWTAHCGGVGRIRDLFTRFDDHGGVLDVVAAGDGVAVYDPRAATWSAQIGRDLSGLAALYLSPAGGWAVGERTRIARLDPASGCWAGRDDLMNGQVALASIMVGSPSEGGWAVGRRGGSGVLLRLRTAGDEDRWSDATALAGEPLPALTDLYVNARGQARESVWLVSPEDGAVLRGALGADPVDPAHDYVALEDRVNLDNGAGTSAEPGEIAMRQGGAAGEDEGWVVGEVRTTHGADLLGWRYLGGVTWRLELAETGRRLADLYFSSSEDRWWIALAPDTGADHVLRFNTTADGSQSWRYWDSAGPPDARPDEGGGSRSLAPLGDGRVVYAWGDGVWVYQYDRQTWTRVRQRRRLVGVAPGADGAGAWALSHESPDASRSALAWVEGGSLRAVAGDEDGQAVWSRLNAIDSGGGSVWAVGAGGIGVRRRGPIRPWEIAPRPPGGGDLVDVAVTADDAAWAVARGREGGGTLLRFDDRGGGWVQMVATDRSLGAVAAWSRGAAWAVGDGVACTCGPVVCTCEETPRYTYASGVPAAPISFRTIAVARGAIGQPVIWASGDLAGTSYLVNPQADVGGWRTAPPRLLGGVPQGARIVALAAGAADDVWAVSVCRPYAEADRGVSLVSHFEGAGTDAASGTVPSLEVLALGVPLADVRVGTSGAERVVWVAGDWSTVLSLRYRPGDPIPGAHPPTPGDLRCTPSDVAVE